MIEADAVEMPAHYRAYPDVEVIDLTKHMNFCLGNVVKYAARADFKGKPLEDLRKARQYLDIEIERRELADAREALGADAQLDDLRSYRLKVRTRGF